MTNVYSVFFPNKNQAFANYLTFSETHLLEKQSLLKIVGEYYQSDLESSTREKFLKSLEKDSF